MQCFVVISEHLVESVRVCVCVHGCTCDQACICVKHREEDRERTSVDNIQTQSPRWFRFYIYFYNIK